MSTMIGVNKHNEVCDLCLAPLKPGEGRVWTGDMFATTVVVHCADKAQCRTRPRSDFNRSGSRYRIWSSTGQLAVVDLNDIAEPCEPVHSVVLRAFGLQHNIDKLYGQVTGEGGERR